MNKLLEMYGRVFAVCWEMHGEEHRVLNVNETYAKKLCADLNRNSEYQAELFVCYPGGKIQKIA